MLTFIIYAAIARQTGRSVCVSTLKHTRALMLEEMNSLMTKLPYVFQRMVINIAS